MLEYKAYSCKLYPTALLPNKMWSHRTDGKAEEAQLHRSIVLAQTTGLPCLHQRRRAGEWAG